MLIPNQSNSLMDVNAPRSDESPAQTTFYDEDLRIALWTTSTIPFLAACIAIGLRLYSRRLKGQKLAWDDYMILVAMGFYVPFYSDVVLALVWGVGHIETMTDQEYAEYKETNLKILLASSELSTVPLCFAKVGDALYSS